MKLLRADTSHDLFRRLEDQWREQCEMMSESYEEFAGPMLDYAREIAHGKLSTNTYAIYILENDQAQMECLAHFNVATLPKTTGKTLRVLWPLLAPRYDYQDISPETFAFLGSELFDQAIHLATGQGDERMRAQHVKVHIAGLGDRRHLAGVAQSLGEGDLLYDVSIRGNWMHMSINEALAVAS